MDMTVTVCHTAPDGIGRPVTSEMDEATAWGCGVDRKLGE